MLEIPVLSLFRKKLGLFRWAVITYVDASVAAQRILSMYQVQLDARMPLRAPSCRFRFRAMAVMLLQVPQGFSRQERAVV